MDVLFGQALERTGRWKEAEADLTLALKLRPDEAELLNYLGYAWIDRGERLAVEEHSIEKVCLRIDTAVGARPKQLNVENGNTAWAWKK